MGRIKPRGRYMAISVPIALHDEISKWVKQSSYNSIAAFVQAAVRKKINEEILVDAMKHTHPAFVISAIEMKLSGDRIVDLYLKRLKEGKI